MPSWEKAEIGVSRAVIPVLPGRYYSSMHGSELEISPPQWQPLWVMAISPVRGTCDGSCESWRQYSKGLPATVHRCGFHRMGENIREIPLAELVELVTGSQILSLNRRDHIFN